MPAFPDLARTAEESADLTAGDLLDGPFQVELRGVLMQAIGCEGPLVVTQVLDGFGVPDTRNQDVPKPQRHGLYASPQFLGGRSMFVAVAAFASSIAALMAAKADLGGAWAPVDFATDADYVIPLAFTLADAATKYVVFGKPMRAPWGYATLARTYLSAHPFVDEALCEFLATDPLVYGLDLRSAVATLGTITGGHGWPHGWPHGWGTATPGSASCVNIGNQAVSPRVTIAAGTDTLANPSLLNLTTGQAWQIAITLAAGDFLVVDFAARSVLLNGTSDRGNLVVRPPSEWWQLQPGTNVVQFGGTGTGSPSANIEWHDGYLI